MNRHRIFAAIALVLAMTAASHAGTVTPRTGWVVIDTPHSFAVLSERLDAAVKDEKMGLVTTASASAGAKAAGFTIPGNKIVGVFRNDFARRMLAASVAAGIEAPIRFYLTENPDGTATLSYKTPSHAFAPYFAESKDDLKSVATELDRIFARIADRAAKGK